MERTIIITLLLAGLISSHAQEKKARRPLSLDQAIAMALEHNLDVSIQRETVRSAEAGVLESLGIFDPTLGSGFTRAEDQRSLDAESTAAAGGLSSVRTETESANVTLSGQTPLSTSYNLRASDRVSADTFNEFQDEHVSSASVTLTQPLLRGRGRAYATFSVRQARRSLGISQLDFRIQVEGILIQVEQAYWDLIGADRSLAVRQKSVDAAESILKQVRIKRDVGTASETDEVQARSGLAQRQLSLLEARRDRLQRNRVLKNLVLEDLSLPTLPFAPTDQPGTNRVAAAREEILREALALRPELEKNQIALRNAEEALTRARQDQRPQVDLEFSYGLNGLGGSFNDSFDGVRSRDDNNWSVGLVFRKPLGDRQGKGTVRRQESALRTQKLQNQSARRAVIVEVDDLYERMTGVLDQIRAGKVAVNLARLNLENERIKFTVQKATVHDLLQLEAELLEAELGLARFAVEYQKIIAELERAKGTLLKRWGIELE